MKIKRTVSLAIGFFMSSSLVVASAAPVRWSGNGHYYDVVEDASKMSWKDAKNWAARLTFTDVSGKLFKGHLATITSPQENNFIKSLRFTKSSYLLGGYQMPRTRERTLIEKKADWHWITGEVWRFTNWRPSEPNNFFRWRGVTGAGRSEEYLQYIPSSSNKAWNDVYTGIFTDKKGKHFFGSRNFIVEYEALGSNIGKPSQTNKATKNTGAGNCYVGCKQPRPTDSMDCAIACDGHWTAFHALSNSGHTTIYLGPASWESCAKKMNILGIPRW